jgi:S-DNA-T family DNA segregation ATPase FtsK/SpoIIIE
MASSGSTKTDSKGQATPFISTRRKMEVLGLVLMVLGLLLGLAFVSYQPGDVPIARQVDLGDALINPQANQAQFRIDNALGLVGAEIARVLVPGFLGYTVLLPTALLMVWGYRIFRHLPVRRLAYTSLLGFVSAFVIASLIGWFGHALGADLLRWAGAVGMGAAGWMARVFGTSGSLILLLLGLVVNLMLAVDHDIQKSIDRVINAATSLQAAVRERWARWKKRRAERSQARSEARRRARKERRERQAAREERAGPAAAAEGGVEETGAAATAAEEQAARSEASGSEASGSEASGSEGAGSTAGESPGAARPTSDAADEGPAVLDMPERGARSTPAGPSAEPRQGDPTADASASSPAPNATKGASSGASSGRASEGASTSREGQPGSRSLPRAPLRDDKRHLRRNDLFRDRAGFSDPSGGASAGASSSGPSSSESPSSGSPSDADGPVGADDMDPETLQAEFGRAFDEASAAAGGSSEADSGADAEGGAEGNADAAPGEARAGAPGSGPTGAEAPSGDAAGDDGPAPEPSRDAPASAETSAPSDGIDPSAAPPPDAGPTDDAAAPAKGGAGAPSSDAAGHAPAEQAAEDASPDTDGPAAEGDADDAKDSEKDSEDVTMTVQEQVEEERAEDIDRASKGPATIDYEAPPIDLLDEATEDDRSVDHDELEQNKKVLLDKLDTYNVELQDINAVVGPTVTRYELTPAPGVKVSRIKSLEDDLAMAMAAQGIRMIAPIPGKSAVGVEIPNRSRELVRLRDVIGTAKFRDTEMDLPLPLGKSIEGEVFLADLTKMPHLLIAGATGSGKSVGLNALITGLIYASHPSRLKFVIIDPKKIELQQYTDLGDHFIARPEDLDDAVITDIEEAQGVLKSCEKEMEERYDLLSEAGCRGIEHYNRKFENGELDPGDGHRFMPYLVVVVDELADLMMTAGKEIEGPISRLAQMARAVGIHLVLATQRPSVDVITGLIKANFPSRIAYEVASRVDSRTILDQIGAEGLVGNGDMLFQSGSNLKRLQGPFVSVEEVERIVDFVANQESTGPYPLPSLQDAGHGPDVTLGVEDTDEKFEEGARVIVRRQQGSVSLLQRKLAVGYTRAARIVDQLEEAGIVGPFNGTKAREVLVDDEEELDRLLSGEDPDEGGDADGDAA